MHPLKAWIVVTGFSVLVGTFLVFSHTFLLAYNNGGEVVVTINDFNEANLEFLVLIIGSALVSLTCVYLIEFATTQNATQ